MYINIKARIITDRTENYYKINKEVERGDPLSLI